MSSRAELRGIDEVLINLEKRLGEAKVRRAANKALRETGNETEVKLKAALEVYRDTGRTIDETTVGGVRSTDGFPLLKIGFGAGSRWRLVHLNELGYSKNPTPRGFGVIRRFSESQKASYKAKMREKLRGDLF